jgi:hypothetical protein
MVPRKLLIVTALIISPGLSRSSPQASPRSEDKKPSDYPRHLMSAIDIIADNHVNPATREQLVQWAVEGLYEKIKKPVPSETSGKIKKLEKPTNNDLLLLIQDIRASLGSPDELTEGKDLQISLQAIFAKLEPGARPEDRSGYYGPTGKVCILRAFVQVGIGLKIKSDPDSRMLRVISPVFDGPAYKAGIRGGDLITAIELETDDNGDPLPKRKVISTKDMSVEEAEKLFLGKEVSRLILRVIPATKEKG